MMENVQLNPAFHIATFLHHFPSEIIYSLNMCDLSNDEEMK